MPTNNGSPDRIQDSRRKPENELAYIVAGHRVDRFFTYRCLRTTVYVQKYYVAWINRLNAISDKYHIIGLGWRKPVSPSQLRVIIINSIFYRYVPNVRMRMKRKEKRATISAHSLIHTGTNQSGFRGQIQ